MIKKIKKYIFHNLVISVFVSIFFSMTVFAAEEKIVDDSNHTYSYIEMQEHINLLAKKHPDKIETSTIGTTVDGRPIYQVIMGNPDSKNAIFIIAAIHGREWMNTWILMDSLEMHLNNWEKTAPNGKTYREVFENCCIYLIPMVNPDGVTISQYGFNAINNKDVQNKLKNMRGASCPKKWKSNVNGVDLNRNFSAGWNSRIDVTTPGIDFYNGVSFFTEPESIAVKNALDQRNFTAAISYHSMEGAIYWDLGQENSMRDKSLALATHCKNITGYKIGDASYLKGLEYNYMTFTKNIPSVCIETGTVACPLPYSQRSKIWKENYMMMVALAGCYQ